MNEIALRIKELIKEMRIRQIVILLNKLIVSAPGDIGIPLLIGQIHQIPMAGNGFYNTQGNTTYHTFLQCCHFSAATLLHCILSQYL